jgi:hypothetical protein
MIRLVAFVKSILMHGFGITGTIPPLDLTMTRMALTEIRIKTYWKANGRLPESLSQLPIREGYDNSTMDGWARPIKYDVSGATTVTLSSLGADGRPGGAGENKDIIVSFDVSS